MHSSESGSASPRWLEGLREHEDRRLASHESAAGFEPAPLHLPRYDIGDPLGRGAASTVYRALDRDLNRRVAIKILREPLGMDAGLRERFLREAKVMAALAHPNVVGVYDAGAAADLLYLVLELVDGPPLSVLWSNATIDIKARARLVEKAARGVAASHVQGVVHRDLKPANILVSRGGEPKVGDFGLAHVMGSEMKLTRTGSVLGTPAYMAPEQVAGRTGDLSPRTDVYALGAILYEGLTGRTPHLADSVTELFGKIAGVEPPVPSSLNPAISRDLQTVILKALEKEPERRYADAGAFADDVSRAISGEAIHAQPPGTIRRVKRWAGRRWAPIAVASVMVVAGAAIAGFAFRQDKRASVEREALRILDGVRRRLDAVDASARIEGSSAMEGRDEAAREASRIAEAEAVRPGLAQSRTLLGRSWDIQGWRDRAEAAWKEAIARDPREGEAHYRLARLWMDQAYALTLHPQDGGRIDRRRRAGELATKALASMNAATALDYGDPLQKRMAALMSRYIRVNAGLAVGEERSISRMRADVDAAILEFSGKPGVEEFHWIKGVVAPEGDPLQRAAFDMALRLRPRFPLARLSRAMVRADAKDFAGAADDLTSALEAHPRFFEAWFDRSNMRSMLHQFEGAFADVEEAARVEPGNPDLPWLRAATYGNRALSKEEARDFDGAIADWTRAIELLPGIRDANRRRGSLVFNKGNASDKGNRAKALADFDEAVRIDAMDYAAHGLRGQLLQEQGNRRGARMAYQKSLDCAPPEWESRPWIEEQLRVLGPDEAD